MKKKRQSTSSPCRNTYIFYNILIECSVYCTCKYIVHIYSVLSAKIKSSIVYIHIYIYIKIKIESNQSFTQIRNSVDADPKHRARLGSLQVLGEDMGPQFKDAIQHVSARGRRHSGADGERD